MRPSVLAVPSILALVCAGGMFAVAMRAKRIEPENFPFVWRHPVTSKMSKDAAADTGRIAPVFHVKDVQGNPITLGGAGLKRPQFVYFVNTDCPCSYAAEPVFHALADQFKGQIDFISVTNADPEGTKKWVNEMDVPYPAVPDKKVDIMHAYRALSSVYSAFVTSDGHIEKMWPGFSKGLLLDINHTLAQALGQPEKPFDTQYAPIQQATGCNF